METRRLKSRCNELPLDIIERIASHCAMPEQLALTSLNVLTRTLKIRAELFTAIEIRKQRPPLTTNGKNYCRYLQDVNKTYHDSFICHDCRVGVDSKLASFGKELLLDARRQTVLVQRRRFMIMRY